MSEDKTICPHCGTQMQKWRTPPFSTWSAEYLYVCFNDDCPYFVRGWEHMASSMQNRCSYRHRYDPTTGTTGPIPVLTKDSLKHDIIA